MIVLKQNVGLDISKDTFVAAYTALYEGQLVKCSKPKKFGNKPKEFMKLMDWVEKQKDDSLPISFTMEATGVYYESLAYFLSDQDVIVHVILPNRAQKFIKSLEIKSKTDNIDAKALGQMGVERALPAWSLSSKIYRKLRSLTREREQLIKDRTRCKNQLHAEKHSAEPQKSYIARQRSHIHFLDKQISSIEKDIASLVKTDEFVAKKIAKITTTPGLRLLTVVTIIAETNGFANTKSIKQLTSFAGYDIILKESGKWKGKTKISKQGNSHIRYALFMPSLSTIQYSETYKRIYERLNLKKQNGMISGTAIQRKLLGLIYTLWKNDSVYIENYESTRTA